MPEHQRPACPAFVHACVCVCRRSLCRRGPVPGGERAVELRALALERQLRALRRLGQAARRRQRRR
eukprot:3162816-Pleurochrysis_carterae.AAC.1